MQPLSESNSQRQNLSKITEQDVIGDWNAATCDLLIWRANVTCQGLASATKKTSLNGTLCIGE